MTEHSVRRQLLATILVVAVLPLLAAFYFLDHALQTSLNLGFSPQVVRALETSARNLKTLRHLDPRNEGAYREQFAATESLKYIYSQSDLVKSSIRDSLKIYFGAGLVAVVLLSTLVAILLGRRIAHHYRLTFDELIAHREQVRYLQQMASWQELARVLAHEIKNPLTPIEVLITSLARAHREKPAHQFTEQLLATQGMITEEISHLKQTVRKFSEFAKLSRVQLAEVRPLEIIRQHVEAIGSTAEHASISLAVDGCPADARASMDATLFRQVLANLVANGVEANPGRKVAFVVQLSCSAGSVRLAISNDGVPVPSEIAGRIFDPYVSTKAGKENMGLGLAIVKKIVVEHGGAIAYEERGAHPCFVITLPRLQ